MDDNYKNINVNYKVDPNKQFLIFLVYHKFKVLLYHTIKQYYLILTINPHYHYVLV
jgi:hypothetical protein